MDSSEKTDVGERPSAVTCPICEEPSGARAENPAFPFCSPRCQLVDLSHWLDERYRL